MDQQNNTNTEATMQFPSWPLLKEFLETKFDCLQQVFEVKVATLRDSQVAEYKAIKDELVRLAEFQRIANGHVRDLMAWQKVVDPVVARLDEVSALLQEPAHIGDKNQHASDTRLADKSTKDEIATETEKVEKLAWGVSKRNAVYLGIGVAIGAGGLAGLIELVKAIWPVVVK